MKWIKIDKKTNKPVERGCNSFMPNDYICGEYRIINNSFSVRKNAWTLTKAGKEIGKYNTLKMAKATAEEIEEA